MWDAHVTRTFITAVYHSPYTPVRVSRRDMRVGANCTRILFPRAPPCRVVIVRRKRARDRSQHIDDDDGRNKQVPRRSRHSVSARRKYPSARFNCNFVGSPLVIHVIISVTKNLKLLLLLLLLTNQLCIIIIVIYYNLVNFSRA